MFILICLVVLIITFSVDVTRRLRAVFDSSDVAAIVIMAICMCFIFLDVSCSINAKLR